MLDFLGPKFRFENEGSYRHKSITGALLSFIVIVSSVILTVMFGQEVYKRKNPNISNSFEHLEYSQVNLKDFPLILNFHHGDSTLITELSYLKFYATHTTILKNFTNVVKNIGMTLCKNKNFTLHKEIVESILNSSPSAYCVDFDNDTAIWNEMGAANSSYLRILVEFCNQEFREKNSEYCKEKQLELSLKGIVVAVNFVDNYINPTNFNKPINFFTNTIVQSLIYGMLKINYVSINRNSFISDDGWLLENFKVDEFLKITSIDKDINVVDKSVQNLVYSLYLTSPRLRQKTQRNYLKVQELFARVGGIVNAFTIIVNIASFNLLRFKYLLFIRENSFIQLDKRQTESSIKLINLESEFENKSISDIKIDENNLSKRNLDEQNPDNVLKTEELVLNENGFSNNNKNNSHDQNKIFNNSAIINNKIRHQLLNQNNDVIVFKKCESENHNSVVENVKCFNSLKSDNNYVKHIALSPVKIHPQGKVKIDLLNKNINNKVNLAESKNFLKIKEEMNKKKENILFGRKETQILQNTFKNENLSYLTYVMNYICFCLIDKNLKQYYNNELDRVEKLLDIKVFKFHLIQAYLKEYNED